MLLFCGGGGFLMKRHHVIIGNFHYKNHSCGRIWISKAVYHICCLYPLFHLQLLPVVSSAICFGFCYAMWEHRETLPLSSESQGGYLPLKMALKHKKDKSQQLQVASLVRVGACVCVCVDWCLQNVWMSRVKSWLLRRCQGAASVGVRYQRVISTEDMRGRLHRGCRVKAIVLCWHGLKFRGNHHSYEQWRVSWHRGVILDFPQSDREMAR